MVGMAVVLANSSGWLAQTVIQFVILIVAVFWDIKSFQKGRRLLPVGILLLAYGVFWLRFGANWVFLANLVLWALYTISKRKMAIIVSENGVSYPSFPKKEIPWSELNNVILKDDLLTIDRKNNKVYQHLIQNSEQFAKEDVFNDFCRNQL